MSKPGQYAGVNENVTVMIAKKKSPLRIVIVVMYDVIFSSYSKIEKKNTAKKKQKEECVTKHCEHFYLL